MNKIVTYDDKINQFKSLVHIFHKSGNYPGMSEMVMMNIMLTASDLGISAAKALNGGFYIVNGKICMSTALMADRIRKSGHSVKITEWTLEKCVMIGKRRDNDDSVKVEYTLEDARIAGLLNSPTWKKFPKSMLYNRAMSMLARVLFPDVVGNAYSEDEANDIRGIDPEKRPEPRFDIDRDSIEVATYVVEPSIDAHEKIEEASPFENPFAQLSETCIAMGGDPSKLQEFLDFRAAKVDKKADDIIHLALSDKELTSKFIENYKKYLVKVA